MTLSFTKMHGLGNDFVVVDKTSEAFNINTETILQMANRHTGVGFDQLLIIESSNDSKSDFTFRIINADGTEVEQCGNGARCVARYLYDFGVTDQTTLKLHTVAGVMDVEIHSDLVTVNMGKPNFLALPNATVTIGNEEIALDAVSLGNPHAVIHVPDTQRAPIEKYGLFLQDHPFFPNQVNVGFMQKVSPDHIKLRVFERGVGETLACGSGACAAVAVGIKKHQLNDKVKVTLPGGDLFIEWRESNQHLYMTGPAETVFIGEWLMFK